MKGLSKKMDSKPFYLFMDNLKVHRMNVMKALCKQLGITTVWNVAYSPDFNAIEAVFS